MGSYDNELRQLLGVWNYFQSMERNVVLMGPQTGSIRNSASNISLKEWNQKSEVLDSLLSSTTFSYRTVSNCKILFESRL